MTTLRTSGPAASPEGPPVVRAARALAERLAVDAERVDVEGVDRARVDEVAAAGLLGLGGPRGYGGTEVAEPVRREVVELLAGACGATWFVTTQHALPLRTLARSGAVPLKERWLRALCTGTALAGVAVAHLRRPGPPAVTARRVPGGWTFDGAVGWTTSWGLADLLLLGGLSPDGEVVLALLTAREQEGLTAGPPMQLAAMQGTATVALRLAGLSVADADVAEVSRAADWLEADRFTTANATPAAFGLLAVVVRRLGETAEARGDRTAAALARSLRDEGDDLRQQAYALLDHVPAYEQVADRLALRGASLELTVRAATALVVATGGSAMSLSAPPQRLAREALFHLVQAQTGAVREATLQRLAERSV